MFEVDSTGAVVARPHEISGKENEKQSAKQQTQTGIDRNILVTRRKQSPQSADDKKASKITKANEGTSSENRFASLGKDDGIRKEGNAKGLLIVLSPKSIGS